MKKHYRTENDCLNCGTTLIDKYCHHCGQENLELKENFGHMMSHAISDYFHFDHLFFHTLKPLFFKPGCLTNEYMSGRRAQYLHPVKMYIFISIVFFLLFFGNGHEIVKINESGTKTASTQKQLDSAKKSIAANPYIPPAAKKEIQKNMDAKAKTKKGGLVDDDEVANRGSNKWFHPTGKDSTYALYLAKQNKLPEDDQDGFLERQWNKKTYSYRERYGPGAKEQFLDEIKHNTPKMMFLLLPLFALILRVAFWKSRKFYVEHLIYAFHLHCFLFLFMAIFILLEMFIPQTWIVVRSWIEFAEVIYIIWYIYRSLRVVYHRGKFRTVTKMIGMSFMYFLAFGFCVSMVFLLTTLM